MASTSISTPSAPAPFARPVVRLLAGAVILAATFAAVVAVRDRTASSGSPDRAALAALPTPTSHAIEARYGMRVVRIGLTADGGMLDLRFIALDPRKVDQLTAHHSPTPGTRMRLIVESSGRMLSTEAMAPHGDGLRPGAEYFTIFRNDGGLIHEGSKVTLVVGSLRLRHLVVL